MAEHKPKIRVLWQAVTVLLNIIIDPETIWESDIHSHNRNRIWWFTLVWGSINSRVVSLTPTISVLSYSLLIALVTFWIFYVQKPPGRKKWGLCNPEIWKYVCDRAMFLFSSALHILGMSFKKKSTVHIKMQGCMNGQHTDSRGIMGWKYFSCIYFLLK